MSWKAKRLWKAKSAQVDLAKREDAKKEIIIFLASVEDALRQACLLM